MTLDAATAYRSYVAELQHGRRGAFARAARKHQVSDEWLRQLVKRHEAARPLSQDLTIAAAHSQEMAESDNSLEYTPPPFAYPKPEPIAQTHAAIVARYPQTVHILSTPTPIVLPRAPQVQRFELRVAPRPWSPVANAKDAADVSYVTAAVMTPLLILAMIAAPVLMVAFMPILLGMWSCAAQEQRRVYDSG